MADIRGIIFDLDGVIADTTEQHYQSWQRVADEEGIPFSRAHYEPMLGTKREENLRLFAQGIDADDATKQGWMERKNRYLLEMINNLKPEDARPGIVRILDEADAAQVKVAVGSSSRNAKIVLEHLQLTQRFAVIGDGNTVINSKPASDIFMWVAGGLGLRPPEVLVIEDSPAGVEAAKNAGFYVVGVGESALDEAHATLSSLADVSLKALFEMVQAGK